MSLNLLPVNQEKLPFQVMRAENIRSESERAEILANPGFGEHFTDHMVDLCWSEHGGWHRPRVLPYGPLSLEPSTAVFHYGQEIFEGLKAYRHENGSIWTFRPERNAERMQASARRLALPELPSEYFLQSLRQLIAVDHNWVPAGGEKSLYLRPFMFAKEAFLGVRAAKKVGYYLIASPAGAYFTGGVTPISIWLSTSYNRAGPGGMGAAKTAGNYAGSLLPQKEAAKNGCAQVLFLDAREGKYLEELGGMNIVLVRRDRVLITPESESILAGITLDSVLTLARERGYTIQQRPVTFDEWRTGADSGEIVEAFACGTAAVITPIAEIRTEAGDGVVMPEAPDALSLLLREELTDIQYGRVPDRHGWLYRLDN